MVKNRGAYCTQGGVTGRNTAWGDEDDAGEVYFYSKILPQ